MTISPNTAASALLMQNRKAEADPGSLNVLNRRGGLRQRETIVGIKPSIT
jgi:hypothetical protein